MKEVQVQQIGQRLFLELPADGSFTVEQQWLLIPQAGNNYLLMKKTANPYLNPNFQKQYVPEEWGDFDFFEVE
ncbi:hypothetical protein [Bombilactobacillus thymidiniphilus]|uniref:Uncharacterized protein n=1 Tax=Bombilactobacillus thymidiniphilus TaxID=2923363 RepID=A0ABY4PC57_9LACO|nr:hypothetical protein [Bombilactobacillus thymidiniphilus]UQS83139.1 hypothetical protein MOO47_04960 [Bombilactobacillus thymidiniphilus]